MTSKEALQELFIRANGSRDAEEYTTSRLREIINTDLDLLYSIKEVFKKVIYAPYAEIEFDNKVVPIPKVKIAEDFDKELFRQVLEQCGFEIKEK